MMIQAEAVQVPKEPGWYTARMKTWAVGDGFAPVKVTNHNGTLVAWQCADERQWPLDVWDWRERIWP